jgi:hypothetical protein
MCRKTLEGLRERHEVKKVNLSQGLRKVKEDGVIEARLSEWAEAFRLLGNEPAHSMSTWFSRVHAQHNIQFTESFAQHVFTYRGLSEHFSERRTESKQDRWTGHSTGTVRGIDVLRHFSTSSGNE